MKRKRSLKLSNNLPINQIICGDCNQVMSEWPDECIDLTVTSPPYDNLRTYNNKYIFNFKGIADQLYRIIKPEGVLIWVIGDSSIGGGESCNSFKQAIYFTEIGFVLNDTMIYLKPNRRPRQYRANRYEQIFEYMFVLVKGNKSKTFNPIEEFCLNDGKCIKFTSRDARKENNFTTGDKLTTSKKILVKETKKKGNVWEYSNNNTSDHPAVFPYQLAYDHIYSWSNEGDIVLDPFIGSGTTALAAIKLNRNYIGIDINKEYCELATQCISNEKRQINMFRN